MLNIDTANRREIISESIAKGSIKFTSKHEANRLDQYLTAYLSDRDEGKYSRSQISIIVDKGDVLVNGKVAKRSAPVLIGDVIELTIDRDGLINISPKEINFDVLLDKPRYAVINKPAGLSVHPGAGSSNVNTLVNGIMYRFSIDDDDKIRPGIVHRLDKDTSGVLLIAKDSVARGELAKLFARREVERRYLAVALGCQSEKHIVVENNIMRDKKHRQRMMVSDSGDGRYSKSEIFVRRRYKETFLAEVKLHTGRTHQIRVHMKHLNTPVLGDELYGNKRSAKMFHRQALHAYKLGFTDPFTGEYIQVRAPLPDDMVKLIYVQSKK